jgi:Protein of unknown function (DUF1320)
MSTWPNKGPGEILDYSLDWRASSPALALSETIVTSLHSISPSGLTLDSEGHDDTTTTAWLSGGTPGVAYRVTCTVTTSAGRVFQRTAFLAITGGAALLTSADFAGRIADSTLVQLTAATNTATEPDATVIAAIGVKTWNEMNTLLGPGRNLPTDPAAWPQLKEMLLVMAEWHLYERRKEATMRAQKDAGGQKHLARLAYDDQVTVLKLVRANQAKLDGVVSITLTAVGPEPGSGYVGDGDLQTSSGLPSLGPFDPFSSGRL